MENMRSRDSGKKYKFETKHENGIGIIERLNYQPKCVEWEKTVFSNEIQKGTSLPLHFPATSSCSFQLHFGMYRSIRGGRYHIPGEYLQKRIISAKCCEPVTMTQKNVCPCAQMGRERRSMGFQLQASAFQPIESKTITR